MTTKTVRRSKKSNGVAFVITATFNYGPYKTKSEADAARSRISSLNGAVVSSIKKGTRGYAFISKTHIGATTASMKSQAIATIKKHAPSAKISVKKA